MIGFEETLQLLVEHRWLFHSPVTKILVDKVMDQFPDGWIEALESLNIEELNILVTGGLVREDWPSSLRQFVKSCVKIRGELSKNTFVVNSKLKHDFSTIERQLTLGLNEKKQHEAFYLAQLTHEMCAREGLEVIVDLGAGLGYVCQLLHHLFNYRVLGLESNPSITATANRRQYTLHPLSRPSVQYSCLKVTKDSSDAIEKLLKSFTNNENEKFCLIGLHSCGDLSTNALRLFRDMKNARLLVMMSCCYHKLECAEDKSGFKNFPMARGLEREYERIRDPQGEVLGRTFMRLACQEPAERWEGMGEEEHETHSICLMARAVLELFCRKNQINLTKTKRKSVRSSKCLNFETYLQNFVSRYNFNGKELDEKYYAEINQLWGENESKLKLAEVYTGLQLLLQAPAEYLVLNDRKCWLEEQGFPETKIVSVLNRKLSPRSHAIVSSKTHPIIT